MKMYWCTKCDKPVPKNARQARTQGRGWVCPDCKIGLPRHPIEVIHEAPNLEELLL